MKLPKQFRLCVLALSLLFMFATSALAENRALIIGIGKYDLPSADLPGISKDVSMMEQTALLLGYEKNQIKVLRDENATLKNIRKAIDEWLVKGVTPNDYVLLYYTGHGSQIYDKSGDEPDKADEVLVSHDATIGVNTLNNVFTDDMFEQALSKIPTRNTFILIDACHSGTATRDLTARAQGIVPKFFSYPGMPRSSETNFSNDKSIRRDNMNYSALSAAQDNQKAQASNLGSFFTRGLYEEVTAVSNTTKRVSMNDLLGKTTVYIEKNLQGVAVVHRPALSGNSALSSKNMFVPKRQGSSANPLIVNWASRLKAMANNADYNVRMRTNGKVFKVGDKLRITCTPMQDGYLNVVNINPGDKVPTVLFPNKFHPDNRVKAGTTLSIPGPDDKFELMTTPPLGKSLIVVFHSTKPTNFHTDGYGEGVFKTLSLKSTRGFIVEERKDETEPEPVSTPAPAPIQTPATATVPTVAPEPTPTPTPTPEPRMRYGAGIIEATIR